MDEYYYKIVSVFLILTSIAWIIYTLFIAWGTECFSTFNGYFTVIVYGIELIWNNMINKSEAD